MKGKRTIINYGDRYGELTLTGISEIRKSIRYVETICRCGKHFFTQLSRVKNSRVKSCGCMREYFNRKQATKHGCAATGRVHPIYHSYKGMKDRCYNPIDKRHKSYWDKGITVCDEWLNSFQVFYDWAIKNGWEKGLSIDRKDGNKGYNPDNCRWANATIQNRNRDINVNITAFNETKCLSEWFYDERCSVTAKTIYDRIKRGVNPEIAITFKRNSINNVITV